MSTTEVTRINPVVGALVMTTVMFIAVTLVWGWLTLWHKIARGRVWGFLFGMFLMVFLTLLAAYSTNPRLLEIGGHK